MNTAKTYKKHFTVAEANRMLPLVRAIAVDMSETARGILERRERLAPLKFRGRNHQPDAFSEELQEAEAQLDRDELALVDFVRELEILGVEAKNAVEGLIDFPALLEGREVYLCWKLGESEVSHWHELDAGFAGRQTLDASHWLSATAPNE